MVGQQWCRVIGVVENVNDEGPGSAARPSAPQRRSVITRAAHVPGSRRRRPYLMAGLENIASSIGLLCSTLARVIVTVWAGLTTVTENGTFTPSASR
jgi:hypothetical protein